MINSGKKWTPYGIDKLINMSINGASHREIARGLGRTPKAISCKKYKIKKQVVKSMNFAQMMFALKAAANAVK